MILKLCDRNKKEIFKVKALQVLLFNAETRSLEVYSYLLKIPLRSLARDKRNRQKLCFPAFHMESVSGAETNSCGEGKKKWEKIHSFCGNFQTGFTVNSLKKRVSSLPAWRPLTVPVGFSA